MVGNISTLWLFNIAMGKQSINGPWLPWRTVSHNQRVSQWKSPFTVHGVSMDHGYQGRKLVWVFRKSHIKELSEKTKTNLLRISEAIILCLTMSFAQFYHAHANVTHKKTNVDVGKRGGVPAARHHEKSGNSRKLSGPSVFGLKHEIT